VCLWCVFCLWWRVCDGGCVGVSVCGVFCFVVGGFVCWLCEFLV
jgi:hypothetical protein